MSSSLQDLHGLQSPRPQSSPAVPEPAPRWKTRIVLPALIVISVIVLLAITSARALLPAAPVRVTAVVPRTVEGSAGTVTVQAPGWLEPDPHPYYVAALADGVVQEVLVLEGDRVERDQVVVTLIADDARLTLERAEAICRQRQAELVAEQATLTAAQTNLENLVDRARAVAVSEAAVAETRAEMSRARANVDIERARLLEIRDEHDRKSKLTESEAISEATVARLRLRLDAQQGSLDAATAHQLVLDAQLLKRKADLRAAIRHQDLLIEERRDVALADAAVAGAEAAVALADAARAEAALRLARMEVRSPVAGIVLQRLASPGSKLTQNGVQHSAHVIHVYDPEHLQVRVDVPLADATHVSVDQTVEVTVEVLPDRTFTGRVTRIVHQADIQKNTVEVKVAIDNPTSDLKPEMLARIRFIGKRATTTEAASRQQAFAPGRLIGGDGGSSYALVVAGLADGRGRVERRAVIRGSRRIDDWIEIESGLQVGDLLIAEPSSGLEAGDRVRVVGEYQHGGGD